MHTLIESQLYYLGSDVLQAIAISDTFTPIIRVYDGKGEDKTIKVIENIHSKPVVLIEVCVSIIRIKYK